MRYALAAAVAAALAVVMLTPGLTRVHRAHACSAGEDFDPIASSDIIIAGRVVGSSELPGIPTPMDERTTGYRTIGVTIEVDRTFKGEPQRKVTAIDYYMVHGDRWTGSSCAIFDGDPTGRYVVLGLSRDNNGYLHPAGLTTFFSGDQPSGEEYERAMARLGGLPQIAPPVTGSGGSSAESVSRFRIY